MEKIATLKWKNEIINYYWDDENENVKAISNNDTWSYPSWDIDTLTDNLNEFDCSIVWMDNTTLDYYLNEEFFQEVLNDKAKALLNDYKNKMED